MDCEHHFHVAPWVLISDPPQAVDICCHCGERKTRVLWPNARPPIPDDCGKFHPERPGYAFTMMERDDDRTSRAPPVAWRYRHNLSELKEGWLFTDIKPIYVDGKGGWTVQPLYAHPEDAPGGPGTIEQAIVHLTHEWGPGYGVACSSAGNDWDQTTEVDRMTCERCRGTAWAVAALNRVDRPKGEK
ncbi:hypothetical protein LCGC14_1370290 [marine sediment metagenome]|uniref:Uncharacterized protein n=1 Tax=marine sediment metagenome TaxID=412755 RepID=A0A0F9KRI2_9ZZZZ